jgi:hypothetical protein
MDDPLKSVQRQTQRYWYVDGLTELGAGVLIFSLGLLYLAMGVIGPGDISHWLLLFGEPALLVAGWLMVSWGVKRLKERITYPRTGYVAYLHLRGPRRWIRIFLTMLVAAGFAVGMTFVGRLGGDVLLPVLIGVIVAGVLAFLGYEFKLRRFYGLAICTLASVGVTFAGRFVGEALLPALIGLMLAAALAYLGYDFGLRRFYGLAIYTLALGGLCAWLRLPDNFTMTLFFCGFGLGWAGSGAWALRNYLLSTHPATEEEL